MPSIFSRIIAGEIPGNFIFQGEQWVGLLDIRPTAPGHALLIPRADVPHLAQLPAVALADLGRHLVALTTAVKQVTGCPAVNVVLNDGPVAGQEVPHVHWHVVPRWPGDGHGFRFAPQPGSELSAMAAKLAAVWNLA